MGGYYVKVLMDDFDVMELKDLNPDEVHFIEFKGKRYDEVRHGRWVDLHCTVCGKVGWSDEDDYCPNCGAKMDLEGG